ncbi:hypothetical protein B0T18DRAFT_333477 [Schizothecium vesticola]|uniref:Uncharacterized protein n=1 Tax=Schizothecium vesticola TaxID=314040 RepID=A0AA40BPC5_9PEZI|nr:hypothetical protein B0T18DRAFT_333477 [Schizothecium vesticola]
MTIFFRRSDPNGTSNIFSFFHREPRPTYKSPPKHLPPPIKDNFPLLAETLSPPPIPAWNVPKKDVYTEYDLPTAPPLLVGFSRSWPLLLQTVVSYITAGWPADQIFVVENTGTQQANARGQLTLQNPFYLNHTVLKALGVNIVQTPTLLSFAQLQNFFLSLTYTHNWPYYFWSHMDVLALSYEDGMGDITPNVKDKGYKSLYTLALETLKKARDDDKRWGTRFFAYDHLTLVNPAAYEDVGGWDTLIPYYMTDCDMHSRLTMAEWSLNDARAGIIVDVSTTLTDLAALYRLDGVAVGFTDPNPPTPKAHFWDKAKRDDDPLANATTTDEASDERARLYRPDPRRDDNDDLERWRAILRTSDAMFHHKNDDKQRNTWQLGQRGGQGEPFYYDALGLDVGINLATDMGREVYRLKWGHKDCRLIEGAGLKAKDQWKVKYDGFLGIF